MSDTTIKIAFQGVLGAYSHQACFEAYPEANVLPCNSFQAAIDDTKDSAANQEASELSQAVDSEIKSITQMPAWVQEGVPSLRFEQHIYASDGEGWVNVNGRDRYEGDNIANGVVLDKILPQQVILTYRGEKFSLPALTNW